PPSPFPFPFTRPAPRAGLPAGGLVTLNCDWTEGATKAALRLHSGRHFRTRGIFHAPSRFGP
ncbi:MAG: hypothetical protein ACKOGA_04265, partial [Planctomycetaceae bacterium]